jgi:hypothetical protein
MNGNDSDRRQSGGGGSMAQLLTELRNRAQLWMPEWRPANPAADPADIVLRAAARTFSEVTSRLDALPDKLFRDYLYWLGVTGKPGQAARIPLVFRLARSAERVMLSGSGPGNGGAPVLLQAITVGNPVPFEIDTPVFLQNSALATVIGAKPGEDFYSEAPAGLLSATGPADGADRWELVTAAAVDTASLQLRPAEGLVEGMQLIDPSGVRYRVQSAKDGLIGIDPPARLALAPGQILRRAREFDPFAAAGPVPDVEPNRQTHALYLGSMTALDVAAAAALEIVGKTPPGDADWHYWGKRTDGDTPDWQELAVQTANGRYILKKQAGAIEPVAIGGVNARWLRATVPPEKTAARPETTVTQLALRINPGASGGGNVAYDAMAPTAQLVTDRPFLPFGREPRRFDSFHIGSAEAFSKPEACVHLDFELGDGFATAMSVAWVSPGPSVAAVVGNDGRLLRVGLGDTAPEPRFLTPIQPSQNGRAVALSKTSRPGAAANNGRAVFAAGDGTTVWCWKTSANDPETGEWQDLGAPASGALGDVILISDGENQATLHVYAVQDGIIYKRRADVNGAWSKHFQPPQATGPILRLSAVGNADGLHRGQPLTTVLAAIAEDGQLGLIDGQLWTKVAGAPPCDPAVYPEVICSPANTAPNHKVVAAFAKLAVGDDPEGTQDHPLSKVFAVDGFTETFELEVGLIGQALTPLRLGAKDIYGAVFAARIADGKTALHLWSPFLGGFVRVDDPMPASSRYVQSPVKMTPDGLWLSPLVSGSVAVSQVTEGTVAAADVVRCRVLPDADPVVFQPVAGTRDFALAVPTPVVVLARLQSSLPGQIVSVVQDPGQQGSRIALFDKDNGNPLSFVRINTPNSPLLLLDTAEVVGRVMWSDTLGDQSVWSPPRPRNPDLSWEYWNGKAWSTISGLHDGTGNLVNSGDVRFCVPSDLAPTEVLGRPNSWIRARLVDGDYGSEEVWVEEDQARGQRIVRRDAGTIRAPVVTRLSVRYSLNREILFAHVLTEDAGTLRDQTAANAVLNATVPIFVHLLADLERQVVPQASVPGTGAKGCDFGCEADRQPGLPSQDEAAESPGTEGALFLGFDAPLSGAPVNLFFQIPRQPSQAVRMLEVSALTQAGFVPVPSEDGTSGLSGTGILSLDIQMPLEPAVLFGHQLYWLRISPSSSGPAEGWTPRITGIHLNAALATAAETQSAELLGSSDASPGQRFRLARPPVVRDSLELRVRELLGPDEAAELAADKGRVPAVLDRISTRAGPWVLWKAGDLTTAGPESRTFSLDPVTGEVTFGNGAQGRIPPAGRDVIMAVRYRTGGTAAANAVAAWGQISLVSAVQGVEQVFAPEPAAGGSDPETVAGVLQTAPAEMTMRNRAVTLRDFGRLALRASDEIGQAVAMTRPNGVVAVVIAMRGTQPVPSNAILRETARFLQQRVSPVLARQGAFVVVPARPVPARFDVAAQVDSFEYLGQVNAQIVQRILRLLDPATGGAQGRGWPFGMLPSPDDIVAATMDVPHLVALTDIAIQLQGPSGDRLTPDAMIIAGADLIRVRGSAGVLDAAGGVAR